MDISKENIFKVGYTSTLPKKVKTKSGQASFLNLYEIIKLFQFL